MKKIKKIRNKINRFFATFIFYIFRIFPIKKNKIVVMNYNGKGFGDNAKYIIEKLLETNEPIDIVWAVSSSEEFPKKIRSVKIYSLKWIYELVTAKVWINNTRFKLYVRKRKKQFYIQTWHSSLRLKKIEMDAKDTLSKYYRKMMKNDSKMIDLMISGSKFSEDIYRKAFLYNGNIERFGTPRCDIFFDTNKMKEYEKELRAFYNIGKEKKIILYAPTFRKNKKYNEVFLDLHEFVKSKLFLENDYILLFRFHPNTKLEFESFDNCINVTNYPDMQKLLCVCDILITDYSSCSFDAMIARKKCLLLTKDLEEYLKNERGTYFKIEELPFENVKEDELINKIINFDEEKYYKRVKEFEEKLGLYEDGQASSRISNRILEVINEKV